MVSLRWIKPSSNGPELVYGLIDLLIFIATQGRHSFYCQVQSPFAGRSDPFVCQS